MHYRGPFKNRAENRVYYALESTEIRLIRNFACNEKFIMLSISPSPSHTRSIVIPN